MDASRFSIDRKLRLRVLPATCLAKNALRKMKIVEIPSISRILNNGEKGGVPSPSGKIEFP